MLFSRVFAATQPRTVLTSVPTACVPPRGSPSHRNVFRINTCKSLSKQTTLTVIESHSYKKHRGWGLLWLTRNLKRDFYPERPSGAEGPLFRSRSGFLARGIRRSHVPTCYRSDVPTCLQPSFVFKGFHTLSFSVGRNSCICHSYENCRVYTNSSHSGTRHLPDRSGEVGIREGHDVSYPYKGKLEAVLVPRGDMEPYGVARDIDADVVFAARFEGIPFGDWGAGIFIRFIFLACCPIGGQQALDSSDQIAESCLSGWAGSFWPVAHEFGSNFIGRGLCGSLDHAFLSPFQFYDGIRYLAVRFGRTDIGERIQARRKRNLEVQEEVIAIAGRSTGHIPWDNLWGSLWSRRAFYQVRRRKRIHPKVQPHCSIFFLHGLQLEGAVADVRPIIRRIFTIRRPGAHKMVAIRRANLVAPRRLETLQSVENAAVRVLGVLLRFLGVTHVHRNVVCPGPHLTNEFHSIDGEFGTTRLVCPVRSEVCYSSIEYVLQILARLVCALRKRRNRKKRKAQ